MQTDDLVHRFCHKAIREILAERLLVDERQTADVVQRLDGLNHRFSQNTRIIGGFRRKSQRSFKTSKLKSLQIRAIHQFNVALPEFCFHNRTLF